MADTAITTNVYVRDNANATAQAISLVASAFSRMTASIDTMLNSRIDIVFKTPAQMVAEGSTLSDGSAAWGFTYSSLRECHINTSPNGNYLGTEKIQYTVLHETGHMVDHDKLSAADRAALMAIMVPAGVSWGSSPYISRPSECFGDSFPRVWSDVDSQLVGYYGRQIPTGSYATYMSIITGSSGPTPMTLAALAPIGATNVKLSVVTGLAVGDWIEIGTASPEDRELTFVGTAGSGGTGVSFVTPTEIVHSNGVAVQEIAPQVGGGTGGSAPIYNITVGGVDFTRRIPAESVHVSESGSDSIATMEFSVNTNVGQQVMQYNATGEEFPAEVLFTDLANNRRFFGGWITGVTRRHAGGTSIVQDVRCVSYDSWLDRRYLANYWTTDNTNQSGNKLSDDRLIVQDIIAKGKAQAPFSVALVASNSTVASTNTSMPKMNLGDGSLRDHILQVAEQAAGLSGTPRRVYVDFYTNVHYFSDNEADDAPYRIGDASYTATIKATSGLLSFWPMNEASGTLAYDINSTRNLTLSGNCIRGIDGGVVNEPGRDSTSFVGGFGLVSSAALHPGTTISLECWFSRGSTGTQQTIFDAGTGDYSVEFQTDNTIRVFKRGTGADFITNAGYINTDIWRHLVVTHSATTTHVYVDGVDQAGTATYKTFVPTTNNLYIGEANDGTSKFNGNLQDIAIYNVALSAATVTAHYNDGVTLVPDEIERDIDYNDAFTAVYVKGTTTTSSGWVTAVLGHTYAANTIIDRPDADTTAKRDAAGLAYANREGAEVVTVRFVVTGYDGWRAGQTVVIDDATLGINSSLEIKDIQTTFGPAGSASLTYEISAGALPFRGHMDVKRKNRGSVGSA